MLQNFNTIHFTKSLNVSAHEHFHTREHTPGYISTRIYNGGQYFMRKIFTSDIYIRERHPHICEAEQIQGFLFLLLDGRDVLNKAKQIYMQKERANKYNEIKFYLFILASLCNQRRFF